MCGNFGIVTAFADESKLGADPETAALRDETLMGAVCTGITVLTVEALGMLSGALHGCGSGPRRAKIRGPT